MIRNFLGSCLQNYRKLIPMTTLVLLAILAATTDFFSKAVRELVNKALSDYVSKLVPFSVSLLVALLLLNVAWLLYKPLCSGVEKLLNKSPSSQRGKDLAVKLLKLVYWVGAVTFVLTMTANELLGKFVIGFSVIGAALTLSLQGAANDFICGLLIQFCRKIDENDNIEVEGLQVQGKILSVGYLSTVVDSKKAVIHVPNREIWARAVRVLKPGESPVIVPSDSKS